MLAIERRNSITKIINQNKTVLVNELADKFNVSTETIRGDFEKLEKNGVLVRTHGGAMEATHYQGLELSVSQRATINAPGKSRIGEKAAQLIKDGDAIFLDASTTSLQVAKNITEKKVFVVTNGLNIINQLSGQTNKTLVLIGGILNSMSMSLSGVVAEQCVKNYYVNKCFFSSKGVTLKQGIMETNEADARVKTAMFARSETLVYLCDKSKIGRIGYPALIPLHTVDYLISDIQLHEDWINNLVDTEIIQA